jgi:hypothetical protein
VYSTRRDLDRLADALRELSAGSIAASRLWHRFRGDPGARGSPLTRADLNAKGLPEDGHCRSQVSARPQDGGWNRFAVFDGSHVCGLRALSWLRHRGSCR